MDQFDQAQELDARFREQALREARRNRRSGESRQNCLDCDEEIPEKRRQTVSGCLRCVACQEAFERIGGR